jgi:hypothetical protein
VHGHWFSTGCLAMGDETIEELFALAADVGLPRVRVVVVPCDLRRPCGPAAPRPWIDELYEALQQELAAFR